MTDELTLTILREIAAPGSGHLFSRREAASHAADLIEQQAARITELESLLVKANDAWLALSQSTDQPVGYFQQDEPCGQWHPVSDRYKDDPDVIPLYAGPTTDGAMTKVREAISDYHFELDLRAHGGVAQDRAFNAICKALGMHWKQGEETNRRASMAVADPERDTRTIDMFSEGQ